MDALIEQVKKKASTMDEAGRKKLVASLEDLQMSVESPFDSIQRLAYLSVRVSLVRVGLGQGLFNLLANSDGPISTREIAEKTGAAPVLQARILRYLASIGAIQETGKDLFSASRMTKTLTDPAYAGAIYHNHDTCGPFLHELPSFLAKTKYQDITDSSNSPFQQAHKTDLPGFVWLHQHPENSAHFNQWMTKQHGGNADWLSVFPFEKELATDGPVFVDVGGGIGHQCAALKKKFPNIPAGKVVLQDLALCIENALPTPGVDAQVHSFFDPQPIKGAKFYYMRSIMHDYTDEKCVEILNNIISAMEKESRILIDEMVLPATGVHWQAAQVDMVMMAGLAAMERTREQWDALMEKAGLKILDVFTYTESLNDSIIVAVPK